MSASFTIWFCYFAFYSFFGWLCETAYCSLIQRRFINRGFLNGPFCPIYGFGAICVLLLLSRYSDDLLALFVLSVAATGVIEYMTSVLLEKIFHLSLWDYTERKWNVNGRVCLANAVLFGLLSVLMVKVIHPHIVNLLGGLPSTFFYVFMGILSLCFTYDLLITVRTILHINREAGLHQEALEKLGQLRDEYIEKIRGGARNRIQDRLLRAFPRLALLKYPGAIEAIRKAAKEHRDQLRKRLDKE